MEENKIKNPILETKSNLHDIKVQKTENIISLQSLHLFRESYQGVGHWHWGKTMCTQGKPQEKQIPWGPIL